MLVTPALDSARDPHRLSLPALLAFATPGLPIGALFMFLLGFLAASFPLLDRAMVGDAPDALTIDPPILEGLAGPRSLPVPGAS